MNWNRIKRDYSVIGILAIIGFLVRLSSGLFTFQFNILLLIISTFTVSLNWEVLRWINSQLNKILPFEKFIARRIIVQLLLGFVVGIISRTCIYYFGEPYFPMKLDSMFLASTWALYALFTAGINVVFFLRFFIEQWKLSIVQAERLEKEKTLVQFDNLKNQMNPHFLFNAFSSLNGLIMENQQLAVQFVQQLSKVYRYVLQHNHQQVVALSTEINFIDQYIALLKTRFSGAIFFDINIREKDVEKQIVPVTLQILIENALKHNVVDVAKPLHIKIYSNDDYLVVCNNKQLKSLVADSNKVGLQNMQSLYAFLSDKPLLIEEKEDKFMVKVPLL
jgi:two-component system LytT family sensor kinase